MNSPYGLNCHRAYIYPELTCDYKKESDRRLIETNPINRIFRLYISKNKNELCYDNEIPIIPMQYNKETKHSLKKQNKSI